MKLETRWFTFEVSTRLTIWLVVIGLVALMVWQTGANLREILEIIKAVQGL